MLNYWCSFAVLVFSIALHMKLPLAVFHVVLVLGLWVCSVAFGQFHGLLVLGLWVYSVMQLLLLTFSMLNYWCFLSGNWGLIELFIFLFRLVYAPAIWGYIIWVILAAFCLLILCWAFFGLSYALFVVGVICLVFPATYGCCYTVDCFLSLLWMNFLWVVVTLYIFVTFTIWIGHSPFVLSELQFVWKI